MYNEVITAKLSTSSPAPSSEALNQVRHLRRV